LKAVGAFEAAAHLEENERTLSNLGSVLVEAGQHPRALHYLERALALSPTFAHAATTAGFALAELGRTSGMRKEPYIYHKEPYSAPKRDLLTLLLRSKEARRRFEGAVAADPRHATAWNNLGHFLRAQQEYAASVRYAKRALRHLQKSPILPSKRAEHHL
jgi:Tfp pilus assembly protein PilF